MKKILLLLFAFVACTTISAQRLGAPAHKANWNYEGAIHERPAGEVRHYTRTGGSWTAAAGGMLVVEASQDGFFMEIVFAEDGKTVYIKDPVSQQRYDSYVEGTLSEDGTIITVPAGQVLAYYPQYQLQILFGYVEMQGFENHLTGNAVFDEDVLYSIDKNGIVTLLGTSYFKPVGCIYGDDWTWLGYGDWGGRYTPTNGTPVVAPEGLETEPYRLEAGNALERDGHTIQVGFAGNDVYMCGVSTTHPEGWIHGTMEGNKVTFHQQYIGNTEASTIFFIPGKVVADPNDGNIYDPKSLWEKTESITFTYDETTKTFSSDGSFFIATATTTPYYTEAYVNPVITYYPDKAVRPQNPVFVSYTDTYLNQFGYFDVKFSLSSDDTEGNPLDRDKLFYRIYLDDERMMFYKDDYSQIKVDMMEEIPYDFTDGFDFMGPGYLSIYAHGVDRVGCQLVYYGGGMESESDITYYDINTKNVTVEPVGINGIGVPQTAAANIYDLNGRMTSLHQQNGIIITNGRKSIVK